MEGKLKFLRFFAYGLEIVILYVLSGIPGFLPSFSGNKPALLIPVALTIAVFESEIPSMIIGMVCGMLLDTGFTASIGYYTLTLTVICFVIGYCARNFFVTNFLNAMIIGALTTLALLFIHFVIFTLLAKTPDAGLYFLKHYLLRIIYTLIFLPPLFYFNRLFMSSMKE